jgi:CRP-like cAMP-binding protein
LRDIALLASCPLFADLEPTILASSLSAIPHSVAPFRADSVILLAGCRYSSLHVLIEGEAFAEMTSEEGKVVRVESFKAVEALASAILFSNSQTLPVSVIAKTPCRLAVIPKDGFMELCMRHKPILEALLRDIGGRLDMLTQKLKAAQFVTLREKIADWILRRRELSGSDSIRMEATRERMAELFGVARPSLSREFGVLGRMGLLELKGREIRILDARGLQRIRSSGSQPRA